MPGEIHVPSTGLRRAHSPVLVFKWLKRPATRQASAAFQAELPRELAGQQAFTPQD